jgi:hypothetical protein
MPDEDTLIGFVRTGTELDDPINNLLIIVNKLVDLENSMDYQSSAIEEIQDNLRHIVGLLERLKK